MRAVAGGYYANLMRMYEYLDIPLHPIRFLFIFAKAAATSSRPSPARSSTGTNATSTHPGTYFVHASNLHQTPPPWPGNRGVLAHIAEVLYLIVCHFWFSIACFLVQPRSGQDGGETVAEYAQRIWLPRRYLCQYLLPLMSSVSTCSHEQLLRFPASDIVNYKRLSHGQQHYAVCGGVSQVQTKLAEGLEDVRLGARVVQVIPEGDDGQVVVRWQSMKSGQVEEEHFDRAVLAVSPDVAARMFDPLSQALCDIPTITVESCVLSEGSGTHQTVESPDNNALASCMHHRKGKSPAQTITFRSQFLPKQGQTEALHTMPSGVVVSTCPLDEDANDDSRRLRTAKFVRTLRTTESRALMNRIMEGNREPTSRNNHHEWSNGEGNVWLAGAWCWDGMVLLEGCIVSAMRVAKDFGVDIPWKT